MQEVEGRRTQQMELQIGFTWTRTLWEPIWAGASSEYFENISRFSSELRKIIRHA